MRTNFIKRKNKMRLKQSFMLLMSLLVMFSGMIPSITVAAANELELPSLEEPKVSKDVEGADHKELITGEDFTYNIHVVLPENLTGYEHMEISDNLDKGLTIQETSILINGNVTDTLIATEEGQTISLELTSEQLEELAGNELVLQITVQVKDDAVVDESIENIAQVLINDTVEIATNSVLVMLINSEVTEKEEEAVNDSDVEEAKGEDKESKSEDTNTQTDETTKVDEEASEEVVKKREVAAAQQQDAEGITINDTDIYLIGSGHILQLDGNDPSIEKGRVQLDNSSITNSLALGKNEDVLYGNAALQLYKIYPDGKTEFVTDLEGDLSPPAGAITPDGNEYVYLSRSAGGQLSISSYNLSTGEKNSVLIEDKSGFVDLSGGDFAFDGEGNLWFSRWQDSPPTSALAKVDTQTGILESVIPVISETGEPFSRSGSLSFLPNGKLLIQGNYMPGSHLFELNPATGVAREIVSTGKFGLGLQDAASRVYPVINPEVEIIKSVSPTETVSRGEELTYTLKIQNSGNLASTLTTVTDELPEGTTYVPHSTTLNGQDVEDENGEGPLFTGMLVNSPNETLEGVLYAGEDNAAIVTFKVTVDESVPSGTEILNVASVSYDGEDNIPSNEVSNIVDYRDPQLSSEKEVTLAEKADGNTDLENVEVGDILRYTISTHNTVEDSLVENLVITDTIPEGLTYVEESVEASHDVDATFENGVITAMFGDVTDTDGRSVTFLVTVNEGQAGKDIQNIAEVKGDNTDVDEPEEEVKVYPREPVLEAEKSAVNAEEGKDKFEVGDTIIYTIQTRNTVSDSLVEDLVITDELPEGLTFVEGSIEVSHDGEAEFADGTITANFGDVEDTAWRTVTFEAVIKSGQSEKTIENTATVEGKDVPPIHPGTETEIDPKDPELSSNKSAVIEEKAEGNTNADSIEVGDTLRYTITTQNIVEDSLVKNLVIADTIPEGLTYVEGSLEVDGVSVTDAEDEDAGHAVEGEVTGNFGDIIDTDKHTVTFLVTVNAGQVGQDIHNIAEVKGDNTDVDEPEEKITVYPRNPVLEAEKSAVNAEEGKDKFEVGDTIIYTIQTRNIVSDSLVEELVITDELPEGLTFVEGSLEVSHASEAEFTDGIITANFGDIEDTEWRTVTFEAIIDSGQSEKTIENTATVVGKDVPPIHPGTETKIDPKDPELSSDKSAVIEEKAEGNTDVENPEVGDTLRYTITTQNTIEDSLVKNLVIADTIPEGLTYVEGSLEVDGVSVTDAEDGDAGYAIDGGIAGNFGDIIDTDKHTVTFLVTVDEGQVGQDIINIATVQGDNTNIDEPEEEIKVYPRKPVLEAEKSAVNVEKGKDKYEVGDTIIYTIQTRNTVSDSFVQNLVIVDKLPKGLAFVDGSLEVSHEGEAEFADGTITASFGDVEDTEWRTVTFEAVIKSGQSGKEIENTAQVTGDNTEEPEDPSTTITVDPKDPKLESVKSSIIEEKAEGNTNADNLQVGDTLRYTITTQNTVEDSLVENLVIADTIPKGLTYVPGSLEVDGEAVTDEEDDDTGHAIAGEITGNFGNITDTDKHTVTFLVTVDEGQAGQDIINIATVKGDNTGVDEPEEEVKISPRNPKLESEKSAENLEKGKDHFEVGDTIVYTIKARNTVSDSFVENLTITDKLPASIEYVEGSLEVSHKGAGEFKDGTITASFGDVTDQEWYTITFQATINTDQSGNTIKNVATIDADNVTEPNQAEAEVLVEEKDSVTPPPEKADPPVDEDKDEGQKLPKTATNTFNFMLLGIMAVLVGLITMRIRKTNEQ